MGQTWEGKKDYMATSTVRCKFIYKGICICMSSQVAQWIARGLLISKWLNCSHAVLRIPYCFPQLHVPIWSYFVYVSAATHVSPKNKVIKRATTSQKNKKRKKPKTNKKPSLSPYKRSSLLFISKQHKSHTYLFEYPSWSN